MRLENVWHGFRNEEVCITLYHLWYDTHPRQRSIKCKTDNWWSGSREHLLQKSSKRPIIEFRFGISSSLPRFHALNPVIWKFWKSISCCTRIWQLRTGGLFPFRIILYYACALQFHGFVELLLICRRLCGIDDLWWFWRRVAKTLAQSVLITYFFNDRNPIHLLVSTVAVFGPKIYWCML